MADIIEVQHEVIEAQAKLIANLLRFMDLDYVAMPKISALVKKYGGPKSSA